MGSAGKTVYQPLHPEMRERLDPEYVKLHDEVLQYIPPQELEPWDPSSRLKQSPMAHGLQKQVEIGRIMDRAVGDIHVRIFRPAGEAPKRGWPSLVWYHGGGWVDGSLDSDHGFLTHICKYVECVVISVNYRHAPEHVYPAAGNDAFAGFEWAASTYILKYLNIDASRLAIGGTSAGGALSAVVSMKAAMAPDLRTKPCFQLLICPVIDNMATVNSRWETSQHSPWLTPARMEWYRRQYFSSTSHSHDWTASPCYAPPHVLAGSPPTFLAVAECDLLAPEAEDFAGLLKKAGVQTEIKVYPGATHSVLTLAGVHKISQTLVHDTCSALSKALDTSYDPQNAPILRQDD